MALLYRIGCKHDAAAPTPYDFRIDTGDRQK